MRLPSFLRFVIFALLFGVLSAAGTRAEPMPKAVIAVLDYARLLQASDAAKDIRRQVKFYGDSFRDVVQAEEDRLRKMEAELKRQRSVVSAAAYKERRQNFKSQVIRAQRQGQNFKRDLEKALKLAMTQLQQAVIPVVKKLTEEKGYTIVVDNSQVLFASRALDITEEVMDRLNRKIRTVAVPKPQ
jgi:Skp family chaperone for outer membrane proteins